MSENSSRFVNDNNEVDVEYIKSIAKEYTPPKRKGRGVDFVSFSNNLGNKKIANISSPIGHIRIDVKSQFGKMQFAKENRRNILFNIKNTLKHPMLVLLTKTGSFAFYSSYKKKNGKLFNMVSFCGLVDSELVLKTSYQISCGNKIKAMALDKNSLLYDKSNPELNKIVKDLIIMGNKTPITMADREIKDFMEAIMDKEDIQGNSLTFLELVEGIPEQINNSDVQVGNIKEENFSIESIIEDRGISI